MPYIVLANRLSFQPVEADNPTIPAGAEELVSRGGMVPDYAPAFLVNALTSAGLIVWAEDRRPELFPVEDLPPQVRTPDMPAVLPSDPNGTVPVLTDILGTETEPEPEPVVVDVDPAVEPEPEAAPLPALPKGSDSKDTWEQYATNPRIGMTLAEAESMNKTDLVTEVKARYEAANK